MLLGGEMIEKAFREGPWRIYRDAAPLELTEDLILIGANSVDVTLSESLLRPRLPHGVEVVDPRQPESLEWESLSIGQDGFVLEPGQFVLGCVRERIDCGAPLGGDGQAGRFVQHYEGRSTCGRLGILSHATAGFGDYGFQGAFTLELSTVLGHPVRLFTGMRIGQVYFTEVIGPRVYEGAYAGEDHYGRPRPPVLGPDRF
jgi:dCTP deaminase